MHVRTLTYLRRSHGPPALPTARRRGGGEGGAGCGGPQRAATWMNPAKRTHIASARSAVFFLFKYITYITSASRRAAWGVGVPSILYQHWLVFSPGLGCWRWMGVRLMCTVYMYLRSDLAYLRTQCLFSACKNAQVLMGERHSLLPSHDRSRQPVWESSFADGIIIPLTSHLLPPRDPRAPSTRRYRLVIWTVGISRLSSNLIEGNLHDARDAIKHVADSTTES